MAAHSSLQLLKSYNVCLGVNSLMDVPRAVCTANPLITIPSVVTWLAPRKYSNWQTVHVLICLQLGSNHSVTRAITSISPNSPIIVRLFARHLLGRGSIVYKGCAANHELQSKTGMGDLRETFAFHQIMVFNYSPTCPLGVSSNTGELDLIWPQCLVCWGQQVHWSLYETFFKILKLNICLCIHSMQFNALYKCKILKIYRTSMI